MAQIEKIDEFRWRVPADPGKGMRVPGIVFADTQLLEEVKKDNSLQQVVNATQLPGVTGAVLAMPDIHYGYGLPIGGVVATDLSKDGVITPGGVGFDINCGVRMLRSEVRVRDIESKIEKIINRLYSLIPCGVGSSGRMQLSNKDMEGVLSQGSRWAVRQGLGEPEELDHTEEGGAFREVDTSVVSVKARDRGKKQLGTLGSGNHFAEIQEIVEIYDTSIAQAFGLFRGQLVVMIHSGSRGLGHQVCTDFLGMMNSAVRKYGIRIPDRQLACAPFSSKEAQRYLNAMRAAANFAWANRQIMARDIRETFIETLGISPRDLGMTTLYDVAHNIVKIEKWVLEQGKELRVAVHRKGATRAFPPDHPELPPDFKPYGQPVIIPGDMGTASYVLAGTKTAAQTSFGSTCHGAGRVLSRSAALKRAKGRRIDVELAHQGIVVRARGRKTLAEEMPEAYKDIDNVIRIVHNTGISKKIAKMRPLAVIKG